MERKYLIKKSVSARHETCDYLLGQQKVRFAVGDRVQLRGAPFGAAGEVMRMERGKVVVFWGDLNFTSRHRKEHLVWAGKATDGDSR